jgi:hypothetical protein
VVVGVFALATACGMVRAGPAGTGDYSPDGGDFAITSSSGGSNGVADLDATVSCVPTAVITSSHQGYRTADAPSDACLDADGGGTWEAYFDDCLGTSRDTTRCGMYKAANPACTACIVTSYSTASHYGPILDYGEYVGGNVAGCLELTTPGNASCAKTVQALTDCELGACEANCPVVDSTSLAAREQCEAEADTSVCSTVFATATACRATEADAGEASLCLAGPFKDFYDAVVPLFCAQPGADGGAPREAFDAGRADAGESLDDAGVAAPRDY